MVPDRRDTIFPVIVVSGLSGAGKSTALKVFEDMGYFTVDGLPAKMATQLLIMLDSARMSRYRGLVLGMDVRQRGLHDEIVQAVDSLRQVGSPVTILYIEAKPEEIIRRYKETRRPHPLERQGLGLEQAMEQEQEQLAPVRSLADVVIDTTSYSIHDIRREIQDRWSATGESRRSLRVHLITFGFKYGVPVEADMVYDLRFLPNPYHDEELRPLSGKDKRIADYVLGENPGKEFLERLVDFLQYVLTQMEAEGRYRITVAIGCTGGRHRSVASAEAVRRALKKSDFTVSLEHRHLELG